MLTYTTYSWCNNFITYFFCTIIETKKPTSKSNRDEEESDEDEIQNSQPEKATLEGYFRNQAKDYHHRYYGHCNTSTDIKEANFFGK